MASYTTINFNHTTASELPGNTWLHNGLPYGIPHSEVGSLFLRCRAAVCCHAMTKVVCEKRSMIVGLLRPGTTSAPWIISHVIDNPSGNSHCSFDRIWHHPGKMGRWLYALLVRIRSSVKRQTYVRLISSKKILSHNSLIGMSRLVVFVCLESKYLSPALIYTCIYLYCHGL